MDTLEQFNPILQKQESTTEEALELFDQLDAVSLEFMMGRLSL